MVKGNMKKEKTVMAKRNSRIYEGRGNFQHGISYCRRSGRYYRGGPLHYCFCFSQQCICRCQFGDFWRFNDFPLYHVKYLSWSKQKVNAKGIPALWTTVRFLF